MKAIKICALGLFLSFFVACNANLVPGPDKQGESALGSAAIHAGAGAVTGAQVGSATGPGAFIGAGLGAVAGAIQGYMRDLSEEQLMINAKSIGVEQDRAYVLSKLIEHYNRRVELHPTREIYPADWFFSGDSAKLSRGGQILVRELAMMNVDRLPWSRLQVVAYVKTNDLKSEYAQFLATKRAEAIINSMVHYGLEGRRLVAVGMLISKPILRDPADRWDRYFQAIEFIPVDR